jgi:hypothetical protein
MEVSWGEDKPLLEGKGSRLGDPFLKVRLSLDICGFMVLFPMA